MKLQIYQPRPSTLRLWVYLVVYIFFFFASREFWRLNQEALDQEVGDYLPNWGIATALAFWCMAIFSWVYVIWARIASKQPIFMKPTNFRDMWPEIKWFCISGIGFIVSIPLSAIAEMIYERIFR